MRDLIIIAVVLLVWASARSGFEAWPPTPKAPPYQIVAPDYTNWVGLWPPIP